QGVIDLVGTEFVVDYKSDREMWAQHHRFKVWAYALAARKPVAHIAYIRHKQLHTIQETELDSIGLEIEHLIDGIVKGDYKANPSHDNCRHCSFADVCDQKYQELNGMV